MRRSGNISPRGLRCRSRRARGRSARSMTRCARARGEIAGALRADLGKSAAESYMCETGLLLADISWLRRNLRRLARPRRAAVGPALWPGRGELRRSPYGVTLIMSPWNYPVLLTLEPLAAAIAAGNTAVVKPSAYSPRLERADCPAARRDFPAGARRRGHGRTRGEFGSARERWDKIFFTGGAAVGREVLRAAAEKLTPTALELGGKSPVIIDESADIALAARRITAGKFLNCGQTCVAPDYVLCPPGLRGGLVEALRREIARQYPSALTDPGYGRMVSERHFRRVPRAHRPREDGDRRRVRRGRAEDRAHRAHGRGAGRRRHGRGDFRPRAAHTRLPRRGRGHSLRRGPAAPARALCLRPQPREGRTISSRAAATAAAA